MNLHLGGLVGYSIKVSVGWSGRMMMWIIGQGRHTVRKDDFELEQPALPDCLVLAGDGAFPALEVESALGSFERSRDEAEGVIFAPLFAAEM